MQQDVKLSTEVVQVNKDDIRLEGAQAFSSREGEVKGAFSSSGDYAPYYLWMVVFIVFAFLFYLKKYVFKKAK
ncbi:MAG: hypothetical protein BWY19_00994 [bacterium ADurb.Bin212]|jgi:hypothetical protein|nr:MAG: hypothetical protein BWY19_00994 [bacterium ADurb.Bin212]